MTDGQSPSAGQAAMDDEQRYRAAMSKDARFDGVFFVAVTSTGIYCRPSCPAITPQRRNVRFYPSAAAAQDAGFRACKRCRPDASPGSPEWNIRAGLAARGMRLIGDGVVDREGVAGLARRLGFSERQVNRTMTAELGAGPLALARAQRAQAARILTETTGLPLSEIAFAAGFGSIRQFNACLREVFGVTPTDMRSAALSRATARNRPARDGPATGPAPGTIRLRLPYRPPIDLGRMIGFLAARAIPGVEEVRDGTYSRTLSLPNGQGVAILRPPAGRGGGRQPRRPAHYVECELILEDLRDLSPAVQRCRRLLDLDADPDAVAACLADDEVLGPLVAACPGRRVPGHVDGDELAVRAVLGQQVSVTAARRLGARLTAQYGKPLEHPAGSLTHCFPAAATLAEADPAGLPMPRARARTLVGLAAALASGTMCLDPGAERDRTYAQLLAMDGIGPWTAGYIRMRALSDPDVFLPGDAGVRRALRSLGAHAGPGSAARVAESWSPWRSYAVQHLWASLESEEQ